MIFLKDASATSTDFDIDDFVPATRRIMSDKQGNLYGIPWTAAIAFQEKMKHSTATAARPGAVSGSVMRTNAFQMPQPSIHAASSSALGTASKTM